MAERPDYYAILGVGRDATQDDIYHAYMNMSALWHPNENRGNEEKARAMLNLVKEAYRVLSNNIRMQENDRNVEVVRDDPDQPGMEDVGDGPDQPGMEDVGGGPDQPGNTRNVLVGALIGVGAAVIAVIVSTMGR